MEYRCFGQTGMQLSAVALGGLLARYEGLCGQPSPEEKSRIYLRAAELGINLFDMGYGDEVYIPDELKGNHGGRYFSLKVGGPPPDRLEEIVDKHLLNLRRDTIDILRLHHLNYVEDEGLAEGVDQLKQAGKVRSVCLIRHYRPDQEAYAEQGPVLSTEADLVIYNYVCRWQEPGIRRSAEAGKAVLIMKALGGQWLAWADQTQEDWSRSREETIVKLAPAGEKIRPDMELIYPTVKGPWQELAEPGEDIPPTGQAVSWVLNNPQVTSILVAFASVAELEETLGAI